MSSSSHSHHHRHHSKRSSKKRVFRILLIVVICIALLTAVGFFAYFGMKKSGENQLHPLLSTKPQMPQISDMTDQPEKEDEAVNSTKADGYVSSLPADADVYYGGKAYKYKSDLVNILLMGIDKESASTSDHQADAIYLIVVDEDDSKISVLSISRNTMTDVDMYDVYGDYYGTREMQLCLAYAYGTDDEQSSRITVNAVSNLLYGLPITGYYSLFMDAVPTIVDTLGGVELTMDSDMSAISPEMTTGAVVTLNGDKALSYIRSREGTNEERLRHQRNFLSRFVPTAINAVKKDLSLPLKLYNTLSDSSCTNIEADSAVYLATIAINADFSGFASLPGTVGSDGSHETYEVDDDQLYNLMLDVFYEQVQ